MYAVILTSYTSAKSVRIKSLLVASNFQYRHGPGYLYKGRALVLKERVNGRLRGDP
jgi:hypothetical protein